MAGPITILDKSAFQGMAREEHTFFSKHFHENVVPTLVFEILGDLSKYSADEAKRQVAILAGKFGGTNVVNMDYLTLGQQSLRGAAIPQTGQIVPDNWKEAEIPGMGRGIMIDSSPLSYAMLRWSEGRFLEVEDAFAKRWRQQAQSVSFSEFRHNLLRHHVIIPRCTDRDQLRQVVDTLLTTPALQPVWFEWVLGQVAESGEEVHFVQARWRRAGDPFLSQFAPYAAHIVKCQIALAAAVQHNLLKWAPTHLIDVQYLYYLPFCMVLVSDDRVHKLLAPVLMRDDQTFVVAPEFKRDLARIVQFWTGLEPAARRRMEYALGVYPPPAKGSIALGLWKKHMKEWSGSGGNLAIKLSEEEKALAIHEATALFKEAGEPTP